MALKVNDWSKAGFIEFVEMRFGQESKDAAERFLRDTDEKAPEFQGLCLAFLKRDQPKLMQDSPLNLP